MNLLTDLERRRVQDQYERHAYPALPLLAFPSRPAAHPLAYELGQYLRTGRYVAHDRSTRILVAGSGTFEPVVVARAHPNARIVAVDLSAKALRQLRVRSWLNGVWRRVECVQADLHDDLTKRLGDFDYIVCTGVVHHSSAPDQIIARLQSLLKPHGVLRLMTYAAESRRFIYELQDFFRRAQTPPSLQACRKALACLSDTHPLRDAFETYSDIQTDSGLVDGFFHACDRPISIDRLRELTECHGLQLVGFGHAWHSQPLGFEKQFTADEFQRLDAWNKIAAIDELGELAVNPVFWLARKVEPVEAALPKSTILNPVLEKSAPQTRFTAPLVPSSDELLAHLSVEDIEALSDEHALVGGLKIGADATGTLPPPLVANRIETPGNSKARFAQAADSSAQAALIEIMKQAVTSGERELPVLTRQTFAAGAKRFWVPSPLRFRMLLRASDALGRMGLSPASVATELARALEPRIDYQGRVLAWLSTGDLLRDLAKHSSDAPKLALSARLEPPSDAQWLSVLSDEELIRLKQHLAIEGGTRWLVSCELALFANKSL